MIAVIDYGVGNLFSLSSALRYLGSHAERHLGYGTVFMDGEKEARTRAFARELLKEVNT